MTSGQSNEELRVLLLLPLGRDASLVEDLLGRQSIGCHRTESLLNLAMEMQQGAGCVLVAIEALRFEAARSLRQLMQQQPPWSDLPLLLLTPERAAMGEWSDELAELGNAVLLERPLRADHLLSVVRASLHARARQYQVRDYVRQREEAEAALLRASRMKDELLALVSHEVRTPLTMIIGAAEIMRNHGDRLDATARRELLDEVTREAARLQQRIENMLVLAKAERTDEVLLEPVLLEKVVLRAVAEFQRSTTRTIHVDRRPLPPILGNAQFLEQILLNLLRNADKYSRPGEPIDVYFIRSDSHAGFVIEDSGEELSPTFVQQICEPFVRATESARRVSGLGLGLPVCKRLAEAQGADLTIRPRPGGGLSARVEFQIEECEPDEDSLRESIAGVIPQERLPVEPALRLQ